MVVVVVVGLDSPGPPCARPPDAGPPPLRRACRPPDPLRRTAQNFALFFSSPAPISFFLPSLGGLLVEFWCFEDRDPQSPRLELSGCRVKPGRLWGSPRTPGNKKREIFGPHPSRPHPSRPRRVFVLLCLFFIFLFFSKKKAKRLKHQFWLKSVWPKSATRILAKVGRLRLAKVGEIFWAKVGISRRRHRTRRHRTRRHRTRRDRTRRDRTRRDRTRRDRTRRDRTRRDRTRRDRTRRDRTRRDRTRRDRTRRDRTRTDRTRTDRTQRQDGDRTETGRRQTETDLCTSPSWRRWLMLALHGPATRDMATLRLVWRL